MARKTKSPPPPPPRSSITGFYLVLAVIALAGVAVLLYQMTNRGPKGASQPIDVAATQAELARAPGISKGRDDAPVVIYEFADFGCPHCGEWASFIEPLIDQRLVQTGLVRYVFYDFPLGSFPNSFLAARAARCANDQDKFWELHDLLFAKQPSWETLEDPTEFFVDLAGQAGVDQGPFEDCLRSDKYAREVSLNRELGVSLGVQGTPTLFINGERLPQIPTFSELEAKVHEKAGLTADTTQATSQTGA